MSTPAQQWGFANNPDRLSPLLLPLHGNDPEGKSHVLGLKDLKSGLTEPSLIIFRNIF